MAVPLFVTALIRVRVSFSTSLSFLSGLMLIRVSSEVAIESGLASGASLTDAMVKLTVAVALPPRPSNI